MIKWLPAQERRGNDKIVCLYRYETVNNTDEHWVKLSFGIRGAIPATPAFLFYGMINDISAERG